MFCLGAAPSPSTVASDEAEELAWDLIVPWNFSNWHLFFLFPPVIFGRGISRDDLDIFVGT